MVDGEEQKEASWGEPSILWRIVCSPSQRLRRRRRRQGKYLLLLNGRVLPLFKNCSGVSAANYVVCSECTYSSSPGQRHQYVSDVCIVVSYLPRTWHGTGDPEMGKQELII